MNIVSGLPPNYADIAKAFRIDGRPGILFCYGDTIFNPSGRPISPALVEHERAHSVRQGRDPESWWRIYIHNPYFRLHEEIVAHRAEWAQFSSEGHGRHARRAHLVEIARRLSSAMYGNLISLADAKLAISAAPILVAARPL